MAYNPRIGFYLSWSPVEYHRMINNSQFLKSIFTNNSYKFSSSWALQDKTKARVSEISKQRPVYCASDIRGATLWSLRAEKMCLGFSVKKNNESDLRNQKSHQYFGKFFHTCTQMRLTSGKLAIFCEIATQHVIFV